MIIKVLTEMKNSGIDIGNSIKFAGDNAFELVNMYESGESTDTIVKYCLDNKY